MSNLIALTFTNCNLCSRSAILGTVVKRIKLYNELIANVI